MKSFLTGRPQHDQPAASSDVPVKATLRPNPLAAGAEEHTHSAPNVECIKQGDKVVRLIITCTCGERIEVDCLYPSSS